MQRVLIIKLTSMGDLMHALPALTDASRIYPALRFDWVVDADFAAVPTWHPHVDKVITSSHRNWRKSWFHTATSGALSRFYRALNASDYDCVIDMQNNLKSAFVSCLRRGPVHGLDRASAREWPAHWAYRYTHAVDPNQHAVVRMRTLMADALGYALPQTVADYGVHFAANALPAEVMAMGVDLAKPYVMAVHNASWDTKLWPVRHWQTLVDWLSQAGFQVLLPCGNVAEQRRAEVIAAGLPGVFALPKVDLDSVAVLMQGASAAVCSDTGLAHLAAVAGTPALTLYGATDANWIGTYGSHQKHWVTERACAPCYQRQCHQHPSQPDEALCLAEMTPEMVWRKLQAVLTSQ